jgi:hypothetical protein
MFLEKFQIYGERCSGTSILEHSLIKNFEVVNIFNEIKDITSIKFKKYGHKHWFGNHLDLSDTDDTLFICIVRDPIMWLNSFYRSPHFLNKNMVKSPHTFLHSEFKSRCYKYSEKITIDEWRIHETNIYTSKPYKNIFELRHEKIRWMYEDLPKLVKNYIFIRYEDLMNDFQGTMKKIHNKGLKKKNDNRKDIDEMKKWMKRDGYENVEESTFEFIQIDPKEKIRPWFTNKFEDFLKLDIKDYPKEYIHYEKLLGYYKD